MKEKLKKILSLMIFIMIIFQGTSFAHSGRTDANGGHKDNKNKSGLGSYHYHCGGHPAHLHTNGVCPYLQNYNNSTGTSTNNTNNKTQNSSNSNAVNKSNNTQSNNVSNTIVEKPTEVLVENVKIENKDDYQELMEGESIKLNVVIYPENANNKNVTWSSSNTKIASVDSSGKVEAISEGEATITVKSNNSKTDNLKLIIKRKPILVEKMIIDNMVSTMNIGDELFLDVTCTPKNADNKEFIIKSGNTNIIEIKDNKIKAVGTGNASIVIESKDKNFTESFDILVVDVKIEESVNESPVETKSSQSSDSNDGSGGFATVALLGTCGIGGYAVYKRNKNKSKKIE